MASLQRNSLTEERKTARPSAVREYGVLPAPLSCNSRRIPSRTEHFAQRNRAPIAKLTRPMAELMPPVTRGIRLHARQNEVAGQCLDFRSSGAAPGAQMPSISPTGSAQCEQPSALSPALDRRGYSRRCSPAAIHYASLDLQALLDEPVVEFHLAQVDKVRAGARL